MRTIEARFEGGLLKPAQPLTLRPGERVGVLIARLPDPSRWDLNRLAGSSAAREDEAVARAGLAEWADALDALDAEVGR